MYPCLGVQPAKPSLLSCHPQTSGWTYNVPLKKWLGEGAVFKFRGDNIDKQRKVRDLRSANKGEMVHMFSILVGRSRTTAPELLYSGGHLSVLNNLPVVSFLPMLMLSKLISWAYTHSLYTWAGSSLALFPGPTPRLNWERRPSTHCLRMWEIVLCLCFPGTTYIYHNSS